MADMPVQRLNNLGRESIKFFLGPLRMEVDPTVREVLDKSGDIKTAGKSKHLGAKTHPLNTASIPDFPMGDMG